MKIVVTILVVVSLLACGNKPSDKGNQSNEFARQEPVRKDTSSLMELTQEEKMRKTAPMERLLKLKWIKLIETPDKNINIPVSRPLVKDGIVFPGIVSTHAFEAKSGEKLNYGVEENHVRSILKDSLLAFQENNILTIQNIFSGKIIRRYNQEFYARFEEEPRILKNRFILTAEKNTLKLINYKTNEVIVEHQLSSLPNGNYLITDEFIFFADKKALYFMGYDGEIMDRLPLGKMDSRPILDDDVIYTFIDKLGVVAVDVNSRQIKWSYKTDWFEALFSIKSDTLFANHGCLTAFDKKTGENLWAMDCQINEIGFTYDQLIIYDGYFLGFLDGHSSIPIFGAVDFNGNIKYLRWEDVNTFNIEGEYQAGTVHPEDDVSNIGPVMMLSDVYDNMIFGQYNNVLVGFEIIAPDQGE